VTIGAALLAHGPSEALGLLLLGARVELEVLEPDAAAPAAGVLYLLAVGDGSVLGLEDHAVGELAARGAAVAVSVTAASPEPTPKRRVKLDRPLVTGIAHSRVKLG
jgi:hypothetical protein